MEKVTREEAIARSAETAARIWLDLPREKQQEIIARRKAREQKDVAA